MKVALDKRFTLMYKVISILLRISQADKDRI